jgi:hypothetical protein
VANPRVACTAPKNLDAISWHCPNSMESATNEASRYKLRLHPSGYPVGIAVALSWLWQNYNHEGVDPRRSL